jgi:periplasmic divalent cation tolerance protein
LSTRSNTDLIVILCTAPDEGIAEELSRGLVRERLAACVNVISGLKSVYRWQGKIEEDSEVQLVIKTRRGRFDDVAAWLKDKHPYDVPEIIALPADHVSDEYLQWALGETC